jgi:hypothetical protein
LRDKGEIPVNARAITPPPSRDLGRKAAIVGIGETDFHRDFKAARAKARQDTSRRRSTAS